MNSRDTMIDQAQQQRMTRDTLIMQKVNQANREAFTQRFPNQIEHHMRLVSERLQACLTKDADTVLTDTATWLATTEDILNLSLALKSLNQVRQDWRLPAAE